MGRPDARPRLAALLLLASLCPADLAEPAHAPAPPPAPEPADQRASLPAQLPRPAVPGKGPAAETTRLTVRPGLRSAIGPEALAPALTRVRIGTHPTFTRIVLDLTRPAEWLTEADRERCVRILIPAGRLLPTARALVRSRGLIRSVRLAQHAAGIEVFVTCRAGGGRFRSHALSDPDRIVVDLWPAVARRTTRPRDVLVVLDPGHGGHATGAVGPRGLTEKAVVLDLARRLAGLLRQRLGVRVRRTRTADVFVPLAARIAFANRAKADLFLSLHLNGARRRGAAGFETFFFSREPSDSDARASAQRENLALEHVGVPGAEQEKLLKRTLADMAVSRDLRESSRLAEAILGALDRRFPGQNRGVKSGPFYILARAAMPAVLVESAFITNPQEERKLRKAAYRQQIAKALFEGLARYMARYEQQ